MYKIITSAILGLTSFTALATPTYFDLNDWEQQARLSRGDWQVTPDGRSVIQNTSITHPTYLVTDSNFINKKVTGKVEVLGPNQDDFIGFVFGFKDPITGQSASFNDNDFLLFDWKRRVQNGASEGFALSRVEGNIIDHTPGFWEHNDSAEFNVLDTDFGADRGWRPNTEYQFEISYTADNVNIFLKGGIFGDEGQTIFDQDGSFDDGRFGFYNFSQSNVQFSDFTYEDIDVVSNDIPEPSTIALLGLMLLGLRARKYS